MSWLLTAQPRPDALAHLFCLPHAGAAASVYRAWPEHLDARVQVHGVQLPGRENRFAETPHVDPVAVADAISAAADRPYALFGHSMGARLAFEVTRHLRAAGAPLPLVLLVSASFPPHLHESGPLAGISYADDATMLAQLVDSGALPAEVAVDPDLRELFAPMIRGDFRWLDTYEFRPQPPLPVPIVALAATDDPLLPAEIMDGWRQHTGADFALHTFAGGHFYLHERPQAPLALIQQTLLRALTAARW